MQMGTAKYGMRDHDGNFSPEKVRELAKSVKAFEIKLSQGAKPGKGGVLPGAKVTEEISRIRGIPAGEDSISPNRHRDIANVNDLLDKIAYLRELTGRPVGVKTAIGGWEFTNELCDAILRRGLEYAPDFLAIDGDGTVGALARRAGGRGHVLHVHRQEPADPGMLVLEIAGGLGVGGKVHHVLLQLAAQGVARTVERKRVGDALHAVEARFRAMCDASPLGIFLAGPSGDCMYLNAAGERIMGVTMLRSINVQTATPDLLNPVQDQITSLLRLTTNLSWRPTCPTLYSPTDLGMETRRPF